MPVGLVEITLKPKRSSKDFLIAPELSQLLAQAKLKAWQDFQSFSEESSSCSYNCCVYSREEKSLEKLLTTMESFTNPFDQESDTLFNLVTKDMMP